jgi:hypothetical protein
MSVAATLGSSDPVRAQEHKTKLFILTYRPTYITLIWDNQRKNTE